MLLSGETIEFESAVCGPATIAADDPELLSDFPGFSRDKCLADLAVAERACVAFATRSRARRDCTCKGSSEFWSLEGLRKVPHDRLVSARDGT
jgi:hypothetical protein